MRTLQLVISITIAFIFCVFWHVRLLRVQREVNFQQNPGNTSHHTFSVLLRYLAKAKSLSFDKVIAMSLLYYFLAEYSCFYQANYVTKILMGSPSFCDVKYHCDMRNKCVSKTHTRHMA